MLVEALIPDMSANRKSLERVMSADIAVAAHNIETEESDFFSADEPVPGIGADKKISELLFSLDARDATEVLEFSGKFYIIQVKDKKESRLPDFDEVKDRVRRDYVSHLALLKAKAAAESHLQALRDDTEFVRTTMAGQIESHPHGVTITKEAPNYTR